MSTTKLTIENGTITNHMGRYFESLSDDGHDFEGNGWVVTATQTKVTAECERVYSDGTHKICVQMDNLKMKTTLTINGLVVKTVYKKYNYDGCGTFGLSGGNIDDRYAYFRSDDFNCFLKKYNILSKYDLNYLDADGRKRYIGKSGALCRYIYTNGTLSVNVGEFDLAYYFNNATVIIKETINHVGFSTYSTRILRTNIHDLRILDKIIPKLDKYSLYDGYKFEENHAFR